MDNQQNMNSQPQSQETSVEQPQINVPSLYALTCPQCHGNSLRVMGIKGSRSTAIGIGAAFGAIGNLVVDAKNRDDYTLHPIEYKCNSCGNKFESLPFVAKPEELLDMPCTIHFERLSSFVGMAVAQNVWLNGVKVGSVGNGKVITFQTAIKYNTIFVTDQYGVAFKGDYKFEAPSGGNVVVRFKNKFV